ncbi:hypothetical protein [Fodinicola feengrottensis]|uniref:Uncharacterized protein n=1 Tax=Fodinicola feengrottensis TaxID=435914 RepID=A0ABN2IAK3_9ACTN|nr:hypothetical protein [Fodinicola feengrottensis]
MSSTYPAGTKARGKISDRVLTKHANGEWRYDDTGAFGADTDDDAKTRYREFMFPPAAPEIKLGTVVEAAYDEDGDRIRFVCFAAQQADKAFVPVGDFPGYGYAGDDDVTVYLLSGLSDISVNGIPLSPPVPELEEPEKLGSVLVSTRTGPAYIKVGPDAWVIATTVDDTSNRVVFAWDEIKDDKTLTLVDAGY